MSLYFGFKKKQKITNKLIGRLSVAPPHPQLSPEMITCSSLHSDPLVPSAVTRKLDSENQEADSCCLPQQPLPHAQWCWLVPQGILFWRLHVPHGVPAPLQARFYACFQERPKHERCSSLSWPRSLTQKVFLPFEF